MIGTLTVPVCERFETAGGWLNSEISDSFSLEESSRASEIPGHGWENGVRRPSFIQFQQVCVLFRMEHFGAAVVTDHPLKRQRIVS